MNVTTRIILKFYTQKYWTYFGIVSSKLAFRVRTVCLKLKMQQGNKSITAVLKEGLNGVNR